MNFNIVENSMIKIYIRPSVKLEHYYYPKHVICTVILNKLHTVNVY